MAINIKTILKFLAVMVWFSALACCIIYVFLAYLVASIIEAWYTVPLFFAELGLIAIYFYSIKKLQQL